MRTFISGVAFYMLDEGERLTRAQVYSNQHTCGYVIWPREGKWDVRKMGLRGWEKISDKLFDTENEALVFAYDKYCRDEDIKSRAWLSK
ncbi:hypothetical protein [Pantoea piersonii]|jgi:hypothetical protein|uniref:hypothetical protein n=1 Tax=Pantoea piersonii TaxID=2364647 RepID=UPI000EA3C27F|nr:hypothetical protein [Pantoea piersonii]MBZ6385092.1 hypothetical protein [Pantoea piersonii]MBZ6385168.1 hypothetical protein [Pantoea piersonii]MBZ6398620.1 hypothetical protein [Pantoea piersonii]MBZ6398696.1 hypothetical protein [Pantoea piersonii]MBZ6406550.1 hypothetical protein [Pantoea piersonii]